MAKIIKRGQEVDPADIVDLPPAGHTKRETLKKRTDELAQAAQETSDTLETYGVNPKAFEKDREIQHLLEQFNDCRVSNADPSYVYCWVWAGMQGLMVKHKMSEYQNAWEVVQGEMKEAIELKGLLADTTRRYGDTILMRCHKGIYDQILRRRKDLADRHLRTIDSGLEQLGERFGVKVSTPGNIDDKTLKMMQSRASAVGTANKTMDIWVRKGTVPGAPAPGTHGPQS